MRSAVGMGTAVRRTGWMSPLVLPLVALAGAACTGAPESRTKGAAAGGRAITIVNVQLVDGTGSPAVRGGLRIVGDTIAAVGADVQAAPGDSLIDGGGRVLAPGFIDTHSHHEVGLDRTPEATAAVSQGITTIVAGIDGAHPMPLATTLDSVARARPALNVAFYAGHGTLRSAVMGDRFQRSATTAEVERMAALLRAELAAGALGLSTGLEYDPGIYSNPAEVLALAKVAGEARTRYISHIRSEDQDFWRALDEIITIGREARLPVQVSHLKLAMRPLHGAADSVRRILDRARAEGIEISADVYPYPFWQSTLTVLFPRRDFDNVVEAQRILREVVRPEGLRIGDYAPNATYRGRTVAEIARLRGEDPARTLVALIRDARALPEGTRAVENGVVSAGVESVIATAMDEDDVARLLAWEHTNICSDGMLDGVHPRGFGAFPRVLGRYAREQRMFPLEEAIRKMTSLSARHVGIVRRGTLAPGHYADLVLVDADRVIDRSTPDAPHAVASGIVAVWVNGVSVWSAGRATGQRPGRVLRRQMQ